MHYTLYPRGVCSNRIDLDMENGIVRNIAYTGGCNGNLKAIGRLCEGMPASEIIAKLDGVRCGDNTTSCSDQLAKLLRGVCDRENAAK